MAYVYIMANLTNTTVYTGVTSDLVRRAYEHRVGLVEGFTKKYQCKKLVYFEIFEDIHHAITREKQIKAGSRAKKNMLITTINPEWQDLYPNIA